MYIVPNLNKIYFTLNLVPADKYYAAGIPNGGVHVHMYMYIINAYQSDPSKFTKRKHLY